jgi:quinol monooxygenase YgiN
MAKLTLIVSVRTQPGRRDDVRALWDRHLRPRAEANAAQELYLFCEDADDADAFHLVEVYGDPAAAQENARAPWFADYMREVGPLMAEAPSMVSARPVWAKGIALG